MNTYKWRMAIQRADLASTTKLVLLNLSLYMDNQTCEAHPTIAMQVEHTGLSNRVICLHLKLAEEAGYITRQGSIAKGQKWALKHYKATLPKTQKEVKKTPEGTEPDSVPKGKKARNDVPKGSDAGSQPLDEKVVTLSAEGSDFNDIKVVTQGHTNYSRNYSNNYLKQHSNRGRSNTLEDAFTKTSDALLHINPNYHSGGIIENWLQLGATPELITTTIRECITRRGKKGQGPPASLKYFDKMLRERIAQKKPQPKRLQVGGKEWNEAMGL